MTVLQFYVITALQQNQLLVKQILSTHIQLLKYAGSLYEPKALTAILIA